MSNLCKLSQHFAHFLNIFAYFFNFRPTTLTFSTIYQHFAQFINMLHKLLTFCTLTQDIFAHSIRCWLRKISTHLHTFSTFCTISNVEIKIATVICSNYPASAARMIFSSNQLQFGSSWEIRVAVPTRFW